MARHSLWGDVGSLGNKNHGEREHLAEQHRWLAYDSCWHAHYRVGRTGYQLSVHCGAFVSGVVGCWSSSRGTLLSEAWDLAE